MPSRFGRKGSGCRVGNEKNGHLSVPSQISEPAGFVLELFNKFRRRLDLDAGLAAARLLGLELSFDLGEDAGTRIDVNPGVIGSTA